MKLLFDQNLSPKLVEQLNDLYPDSTHVHYHNLGSSNDSEIWDYAVKNNFTIVSKDSDFSDLIVLRGFPPKFIWIRRGNCSTVEITQMLREKSEQIEKFHYNKNASIFILF